MSATYRKPPQSPPDAFDRPRVLTEEDAIAIWIARWLRVRLKDVLTRYNCDPRRLYEIWEGHRFPESRAKAIAEFSTRYPALVGHVDASHHRRRPLRARSPDQLSLFD